MVDEQMRRTTDIDPVEFGKLIQAVSTLTNNVNDLSIKVDSLNSALTSGKGIMIGLAVTAGGIGAAIGRILGHTIK